jgi:hypothetical protein
VVPSLRAFVALTPELPDGPVTLDAKTWKVVVAIAGGATVAELAGDLGLTEVPACRAVRDVVELGIAICAPTPPDGWDDVDGVTAPAIGPDATGGDGPDAAFGHEADTGGVHPVGAPMPAWDDAPAAGPAPAWDDAPAALAWAADPVAAPWTPGPAAVLPAAPAWDHSRPETVAEPEFSTSAAVSLDTDDEGDVGNG